MKISLKKRFSIKRNKAQKPRTCGSCGSVMIWHNGGWQCPERLRMPYYQRIRGERII